MRTNYLNKDVQGLRAFAVLSVLLCHVGSFLPGGYIGVDIFFVISGFVITKSIYSEFKVSNKINFRNFYSRRIKRILPLTCFVLFLTSVIAIIIVPDSDYYHFVGSLKSSILFFSNFYFWGNTNYFSPTAQLIPILHTWSLSVEEQFYIILPIIIFITQLYSFSFKIIIFITTILSFLLSTYLNSRYPVANFYLLPSRIFEFGIGILLYLYKEDIVKIYIFNVNHNFWNILSLNILLISSFLFNQNSNTPNFLIVFPLLAVCYIIIFGSNSYIIRLIFHNKFIQFIGLISFSLYLFHQPIFVFYRKFELYEFLFIPASIFLTFILSIFSYFFIEKKFRYKVSIRNILIIYILFFVWALFISTTSFLQYRNALLISSENKKYYFNKMEYIDYRKNNWPDNIKSINENSSILKYKKILVIGDSISEDVAIGLKIQSNTKIAYAIIHDHLDDRCNNFYLNGVVQPKFINECKSEVDDELTENINTAEFIVLNQYYDNNTIESTINLAKYLSKIGKKVIFITKYNFKDVSEIAFIESRRGINLNNSNFIKYFNVDNNLGFNRVLRDIKDFNNIKLLNGFDIFCKDYDGTCSLFTENFSGEFLPLLYDNSHVTIHGAPILGRKVMSSIKYFEK